MTNHPYEQFESTNAWRVIDAALSSLVEHGDLKETTARRYIVGFLCQALSGAELLSEASGASSRERHKRD
jgi:hypothetical protein